MRNQLHEGEWLAALEKGVAMINSCEEKKKGPKSERIVMNYMQNLFRMTPFSQEVTYKQIKVKLETCTLLWVDHLGRVDHSTRLRYGRVK